MTGRDRRRLDVDSAISPILSVPSTARRRLAPKVREARAGCANFPRTHCPALLGCLRTARRTRLESEIAMYDHIGLKVGNLDAAVRFYTADWRRSAMSCVRATIAAPASGEGRAGALALSAQGPAAPAPYRVPRARPRRDQEIPHERREGRGGQWRRRPARRLQPDLFRRVPNRS